MNDHSIYYLMSCIYDNSLQKGFMINKMTKEPGLTPGGEIRVEHIRNSTGMTHVNIFSPVSFGDHLRRYNLSSITMDDLIQLFKDFEGYDRYGWTTRETDGVLAILEKESIFKD